MTECVKQLPRILMYKAVSKCFHAIQELEFFKIDLLFFLYHSCVKENLNLFPRVQSSPIIV